MSNYKELREKIINDLLEYEELVIKEKSESNKKNGNDRVIDVRPYSDLFKNIGLGFAIMLLFVYFKHHLHNNIVIVVVGVILLFAGMLFIVFSIVDFFMNHTEKWFKGFFKWLWIIFVGITFAAVAYFCNNMIIDADAIYGAPVKCIIN